MKIDIAYDIKNKRYVAYNIEAGIIATGVCVTTALENFKAKELEVIMKLK